MGNLIGSIFGKKRYRILMLGLDNAGKTSIIQYLRRHEFGATIPTVGFVVETVTIDQVQFTVWDVGGQNAIRPLWRHYYHGSQGLIFVIDSSDRERLGEAASELEKILSSREMRNVSLLVFCNKQDLPQSVAPTEIQKILRLDRFTRTYLLTPCSTSDGSGLAEGFKWLAKHCK